MINIVLQGGHTPGLETPDTPVGPDGLDGGDVVDGVGGDGLASGCRVRRVVWVYFPVIV